MNETIALSAGFLLALWQAAGPPPVRSIDKGVQSGIALPRQVIVRDAKEWTTLWRAHASARPQPAVDFSREMVVGVFIGTRPTAGFAVEIIGYREAGNDVTVRYRETTPDRDAIAAQVLVSPYHLVAIPQRAGGVTFEKVQS